MRNKKTLGIFALTMVAILGVGVVSAYGLNGLMGNQLSEEEIESHRTEVENAIETGDYSSWEGLMQDRISMMEDMISEENFELLQEQHQNREEFHEAVQEMKDSGEFTFEDMEALREQFGIENNGRKDERKMMHEMHSGNGMGFRPGDYMRA